MSAWDELEVEARDAFAGEGRFPLPAYSEYMPSPHVVVKPYAARRADRAATVTASDGDAMDVTEEEQAHELAPGLGKIAGHVLAELERLVDGKPHDLSRTLLAENAAWPRALTESAPARRAAGEPIVIALSLALSRTQDDKGNVRWTLFGVSHDGPGAAFWRSFADDDREAFARFVGWAAGGAPLDRVRILAEPSELPAFARALRLEARRLARWRRDAGDLPSVRGAAAGGAAGVPRRQAAPRPPPRGPDLLRARRATAGSPRRCRAPHRFRCCISSRTSPTATRSGSRNPAGSTSSTTRTRRAPSTATTW